jgi:hypothetical protein
MVLVMISIPLFFVLLAVFVYPSYSEGKQMITGDSLYSNQRPRLK